MMHKHESSIRIEFSGQLHNIDDLERRLGVASKNVETLLLEGWRRWGTGLASELIGDYALTLHDDNQRLIYLVRNPLGVKPLYYRIDKGKLAYAFSIPELNKRCTFPLTKNMDWVASYLLGLSFSTTDTAYKEIKKVPPGHWLSCNAEGQIKVQRYHVWRDDAPFATKRDKKWVEAYRDVLEEAIRCRMDPDAPMGTENSGGIDSATITAYLAHFLGEPGNRLYSFGFALCEQEPAFILETSQAKKIRHNYIITDAYAADNIDSSLVRGLSAIGYPEEHGNATSHMPFYQECQKRGIRTLHSGFGGDEVVTNHGRHLRWELLDRHQYGALWEILPGDPVCRSLRLLKAATLGRKKPAHNPSFLNAWNQRWPYQLLKPEVVQRLDLYEKYMETAIYDAPYRRTNDFILQHHLKRMRLSARLENCTLVAAAYGVDYRWPFWDVRLIQQYLSTPSIEKVGPKGIGRYLHRRAIDGVVPKRVAWKPSKDMGYAKIQQQKKFSGIIQTGELARAVEGSLHPALDQLIDRARFRKQIEISLQGNVDTNFSFSFSRAVNSLRWLNVWLNES